MKRPGWGKQRIESGPSHTVPVPPDTPFPLPSICTSVSSPASDPSSLSSSHPDGVVVSVGTPDHVARGVSRQASWFPQLRLGPGPILARGGEGNELKSGTPMEVRAKWRLCLGLRSGGDRWTGYVLGQESTIGARARSTGAAATDLEARPAPSRDCLDGARLGVDQLESMIVGVRHHHSTLHRGDRCAHCIPVWGRGGLG